MDALVSAFLLPHTTLIHTDKYYDPHFENDFIPSSAATNYFMTLFTGFFEWKVNEFNICFNDRGNLSRTFTDNFRRIYCLSTRGKTTVESSYMYQFENPQPYISINDLGPNESYDFLRKTLLSLVENKIYKNELLEIDLLSKSLLFDNEETVNYNKLIWTDNINEIFETDTKDKVKYIYECDFTSENDISLETMFYKVFAIGKPYTCKTYNGGKIYYETTKRIYDNNIEGNKIVGYSQTVQILDNLRLTQKEGIELIGKSAEWNLAAGIDSTIIRCGEIVEYFAEENF